jgi:hypothetical protein
MTNKFEELASAGLVDILTKYINDIHNIICTKKAGEDIGVNLITHESTDAWYRDNIDVLQKIGEMGGDIAKRIRENKNITWEKTFSLRKEDGTEEKFYFKKKDGSKIEWEDAPDGKLIGITILLACWIANQATAKTRDNPNNNAKVIFDNYLHRLIEESINLGIKMAERK